MANLTSNIDVDYIQKDYQSTVDALVSFATVNYGEGTSANRLWTNFNSDSFSRNFLEIVAYVADTLFFYLDSQATQNFLQTATVQSAVNDIAKQFGFVPATATSASGNVTFTLTAAGTIPRGFRVADSSGLEYYLTNDIIAGGAGNYTGTVIQGVLKSETFSSIGLQNEEFLLSAKDIVRDQSNTNPNDISPRVTVNGNQYKLVDSFLRFNGTDVAPVIDSLGNIIGGGGRVFVLEYKPDGTPFIRFGDGIFGRKLIPSDLIVVNYRSGGGSAGNIAAQGITRALDSNAVLSAVSNAAEFSGGADAQSIEQLRELIPASLRTLERAVAEQDYSDILIANFNEVFTASTEINNDDAGIDINIYVVPNGAGIPKISQNTILQNKISDFLDRRKMVTIQYKLEDAFGIDILVGLEIFISTTSSKNTVQQAIITALQNYFSLTTGGASEAGIDFAEPILLKDITNIIESVSGVERFEIKRLTYRPRVEETIVGLITDYNFSEITIYPNIQEREWVAAASGQITKAAGTVGNLFSNSALTGFNYNSASGQITYTLPVDLENVAPGDLFRNGPGLAEITTIQTVGDGVGAAEVVKITTVADDQGKSEISDITTVADVSGSLASTYFTLYDTAGSVAVWFSTGASPQPAHGANRAIQVTIALNATANAVATALQTALNADSEFTASVLTNVVTVTLDTKLSVSDVVDFNTGFTFAVVQDGENPDSLASSYFDIYDDVGPVRVWINLNGSSPAPAVPFGGRLLPITGIISNDSAVVVATNLQALIHADSKFNATRVNNEVTITNALVGSRTDTVDFNTGFTITTLTQGANAASLSGKYFDMYDDVGAVRVWIDVDNLSAAPVAPIGGRLLEVDITAGASANAVATAVRNAIDADAKFSAPAPVANLITVTVSTIGPKANATDVNTGFTLLVSQQGVDNNTDFVILAVDKNAYSVTILPNLAVNPVPGLNAGGSIMNGQTTYESFKVFKKLLATTTNLSTDSITDSSLDLSVKSGTAAALSARVLLDNANVYIYNELSTGEYLLVDSAGNIWDIVSNDSNTIKVSITALNDASVTTVAAGSYKIVAKLTGNELLFQSNRFVIQYNTENTIFSIGALFNQIGTIGDAFAVSEEQTNVGSLGVDVDLIAYNQSTQQLRLNGSPDLSGVSSEYVLIDNTGQILNLVAVDNTSKDSVAYASISANNSPAYILEDSLLGSQYAQGFKVNTTDTYTVISLYLKKMGNVVGSLTARIVADDGSGLPDLASPVAVSKPVNLTDLPTDSSFSTVTIANGKITAAATTAFEKIVFSFDVPPNLTAGVQYHVVLSANSSYNSTQLFNVTTYNNSPFVGFTYAAATGIITYASTVNLTAVSLGNYFVDGLGRYYKVLGINESLNEITIATGVAVDTTSAGHIKAFDTALVATNIGGAATYTDGKFSRFDGSLWADEAQGPVLSRLAEPADAFFTIEGPKSIKIESNLTPVLGEGATLSKRYYDDENELSFILGFAGGSITSATDANAFGKGTVVSIPNSKIDSFVWRTSRYTDDIVNLRLNEIPQISESDISLTILGGVD